ncbi:MAG: lipopolysaccharide biosynthesis protein [Methylocystaceae bacterium]|nr:lipopolysaccharide biosynthesis protein [Methylocystaceae bacterium]
MLIRHTLLYLPAQLGGPFLQFLITILWTYWLVPGQYGVLTAIIAAQELAYILCLFWWSSSALRYSQDIIAREGKSKFQGMDNTILLVTSVLQILLAPILFALAGHDINPALLLSCSVFMITRSIISHLSERTRAASHILIYTHLQVSSPVISLTLAYGLILYYGASIQTILSAFALAQSLVVILCWYWLSLGFSCAHPDKGMLLRAAKFGLPLTLGGIFGWLSLNAVRLIVGSLYGSDQLGLLSVGWGLGQRFASVAAMLVTAAAFPLAVARMDLKNKHASLVQISSGGMLLFALLCPATVGIYMITPSLVELAIAEPFRSVTTIVLPLAMIASAVRNFRVHYPDQSLMLLEVTSLAIIINLVEAVITLALCFAGALFDGPIGAVYGCVWGSLIGCLIGFAVRFFKNRIFNSCDGCESDSRRSTACS